MCQGSVNNNQMVQAIGQARETTKLAERAVRLVLDNAAQASDEATTLTLQRAAKRLAEASDELHQAMHAAAEPVSRDSIVIERI